MSRTRHARGASLAATLLSLLPLPVLAQDFHVTVTDMAGREITVPAFPETVFCFNNRCAGDLALIDVIPDATERRGFEMLSSIHGEAVADIPVFLNTDGFDFEAIFAGEPDLILSWGYGEEVMFSQAAPTYVYTETPATEEQIDETKEQIIRPTLDVARLFGAEELAQERISAILDRAAAYARLSPNNLKLQFAALDGDEGVVYLGNRCTHFVTLATPCAQQIPGGWYPSTVEALLQIDPDVIVIGDTEGGERDLVQRWNESNALWQELKAVREGRVFLVPRQSAQPEGIYNVGPVLDTLMPLLYPETFPAPLTDDQIAAALASE